LSSISSNCWRVKYMAYLSDANVIARSPEGDEATFQTIATRRWRAARNDI